MILTEYINFVIKKAQEALAEKNKEEAIRFLTLGIETIQETIQKIKDDKIW